MDYFPLSSQGAANLIYGAARGVKRTADYLTPFLERNIDFGRRRKRRRTVRRRFGPVMPYRPRRRAPRRRRRKSNYSKRVRARAHRLPEDTIRSRTRRSMVMGSGRGGLARGRLIARFMRPQGTNTSTRRNLKILDYDQPTVPTSAYAFHYDFKLTDFYGYGELDDIYKYYKIEGVALCFYPLQNAHLAAAQSNATNPIRAISATAVTNTGSAPRIVVCADGTSVADFNNEDEALAHTNSRFHVFNDSSEFSVYAKMNPLDVVGREGDVTHTAGKPMWLPTSADGADVEHRGFRGYVSNLHSAIQILVYCKMYVRFKGLKA
jgi:hypothetical protein